MNRSAASNDRPPAAQSWVAGPLVAEQLAVVLGGRRVLADVDVRLGTGWTAVVGPNGAGKSTLLRALAGLQPAHAGRVMLDGRPLGELPPARRARCIAWLAQQGEAGDEMTVHDTVALGRIAHLGPLGRPGAGDAAAVAQAMALTGCSAWAGRRLGQLSGGERQRVLLARVLATEAPLLLLDEPTTHLDAPHQVALARLFRRLAADHAVVTVLHDLAIALHADRLLVLDQGRLVADGAPADAAVQRRLEAVFHGAVRVDRDGDGRLRVGLALDQG